MDTGLWLSSLSLRFAWLVWELKTGEGREKEEEEEEEDRDSVGDLKIGWWHWWHSFQVARGEWTQRARHLRVTPIVHALGRSPGRMGSSCRFTKIRFCWNTHRSFLSNLPVSDLNSIWLRSILQKWCVLFKRRPRVSVQKSCSFNNSYSYSFSILYLISSQR